MRVLPLRYRGRRIPSDIPLARYPETKITYQVVSKVELLNKKSMFNLFNAKSPELAKAINHYEIIADLF